MCGVYKNGSRVKNPRNIAHLVHVVGGLRTIPVAVKRDALKSWASACILSFAPGRFKVKDIVQILHAYSQVFPIDEGLSVPEVIQLMDAAILGQLQYMDTISVSAIVNSMGHLGHVPNPAVVGGLLATASQGIGQFNAQSLSSLLRGLAVWADKKVPMDVAAIDAILSHEVPLILNQIPEDRLVPVLRSLGTLTRQVLIKDSAERAVMSSIMNLLDSFPGGNDWTVAGIASASHLFVGNSFEYDRFIHKFIVPLAKNKDMSSNRNLQLGVKVACILADHGLTNSDQLHSVTQVLMKTNSLDPLVTLIRSLSPRGAIDELTTRIAQYISESDLSRLSGSRLEDLAEGLWTLTGNIHPKVKESMEARPADEQVSLLRDWILKSVTINTHPEWEIRFIEETGRNVNNEFDDLNVPPPGYSRSRAIEIESMIDQLDPEFRGTFMERVLIVAMNHGQRVRGSDISLARQLLRESGCTKALLVPWKTSSSHSEKQKTAIDTMHAVLSLTS